jgi:hypothetical protein
MSRRKTRCMTWGECKRSGSPLVDENGRRVGFIDFAEYVTLCGKPDENPKDAPLDHRKPRPVGVCPARWTRFRADMTAAEFMPDTDMPRGFDGKPVQVVVTTGASGVFVGTSGVVVSHLDEFLHRTGKCRCHGQGECAWCMKNNTPF